MSGTPNSSDPLPSLTFVIDDKYDIKRNEAESSPTFISDLLSPGSLIHRGTQAQYLDTPRAVMCSLQTPQGHDPPYEDIPDCSRGNYWDIVMGSSSPTTLPLRGGGAPAGGGTGLRRGEPGRLVGISKPAAVVAGGARGGGAGASRRAGPGGRTGGKPFPCKWCDKGFDFRSHLNTHKSTVHDGARDHVCPHPGCGSAFGQKSNLNKHIRVVHEKRRPYGCSRCPKMFSQRSVATAHFNAVHLKRKDFACPQCAQLFSDRSNLKKHVKLVHLREKRHVCDVCGKAFGEKRSLTDHKSSVHMKIKPHACWEPGCGAVFGQKSHLSTHYKTMHLKERPFKCDRCSKTFAQRPHLEKHVLRCAIVNGND